ncbi:hypothetical protein R69749_02003 [Paraburkholderia domus]|jgi:P pilus assembly protein, pilin FimA|uniref:Fimbrial-type adhesion domain-containing protein n=3 Tax=Paraburkholderia domus TaxID=2793075 RepID=A0A9N8QY61_9BURK|nr:fimbrial protein [Paraburkholderia domus]MCI0146381.1 type 1 fimbrial protein [Paraburkholderia sediminicola]CAE6738203.1 hypothetical protein R75483_02534 [Paraburkholderia domus]CAE6764293.1 hypothetical protein R70006_03636 [Paraburkholderia domus]CAE6787879.1 hypothetical protein R69749_02003 [Paraburkholderia domus]CAE6881506.1 hypothetical protein R70199_02551 [Paraburkholderia domus]
MFKSESGRRSVFRILIPLMITLGAATAARADCPTTGLPATFTYGTIAVSNTLAVGTVIPGTVQSFTLSGKCSAPNLANQPVVACPSGVTAVTGMTGVYPTNVAGVGMRMRDSKGTPLVGTGYCSTTSSLGNTAADGSFTVSGTFELVATGSIQGGTISGALYNTGILNTGVTLNNGNSNMSVASGTAIRPVTCSVDPASANQRVPLATVSPTMFAGAGSTAATTPFSINLVCQAGVNVAVTFSSATGTSGVPTVLASNGTATGIGVQLLNALNTPITLDSPLLLTSATTGNTSFQFFAQYYRLGATGMTPGRVNAAAIFTMNYQ